MKLFYYQREDKQPNFGDELNQWLWPKLCPGLFDQDSSTLFVGTGTLLNSKLAERLKSAEKVVIFSTGAGYEQPVEQIPNNWKICCVRGPLSARQLGLPPKMAIADGGILIAKLFTSPIAPVVVQSDRTSCSFMPHIHSATAAAETWQRICEQANIRYIDPRWPIEDVLKAIGASELVLAEAMHGAIAADAPCMAWIPVVTSPRIYAFKWQDWCASMQLPYRPCRLPPLINYPRWGRGLRSGAIAARHYLGAMNNTDSLQYAIAADEGAIVRRLTRLAKCKPFLSHDQVFEQRLAALTDTLKNCTLKNCVDG
ncbi:MAG: polysaccharide pyruvyl transferase family protein [Phormidesmis sp.]